MSSRLLPLTHLLGQDSKQMFKMSMLSFVYTYRSLSDWFFLFRCPRSLYYSWRRQIVTTRFIDATRTLLISCFNWSTYRKFRSRPRYFFQASKRMLKGKAYSSVRRAGRSTQSERRINTIFEMKEHINVHVQWPGREEKCVSSGVGTYLWQSL